MVAPVRAPTEFRYEERRNGLTARTLRRALRTAFGFDPEPTDAFVRAFGEAYFEGDPIAEDFVRAELPNGGLHGARRKLDAAVEKGALGVDVEREASDPLGLFLKDALSRPSWVSEELLEIGAASFRRYGSAVFRFAGAITLAGYRESSVAKPLALSGAYVGANTRARFLETASFWIEVSEPGGLTVGAPGFMAALRVRLLHATVRLRLENHREWNREAWGVPINTGDALLTLMGGSLAPGLGMRVLGFRTTRREIEAMLHFWRYVGHLMGVRFTPFPETVEDAVRLAYAATLKASNTAGEDGRLLCQSYDQAFARREDDGVWGYLEHAIHRGMTGLFLPPPLHRSQGLPSAGLWPLLPLLPYPLVFGAETLRRRIPAVERWMDALARKERRAWLTRHTRKAAAFEPSATLRR